MNSSSPPSSNKNGDWTPSRVKQVFWDIFSDKMGEDVPAKAALLKDPRYKWEKEVLREHYMPLVMGIWGGFICFVGWRIVKFPMVRQWREKRWPSSSSSVVRSNPPPGTASPSSSSVKQPRNRPQYYLPEENQKLVAEQKARNELMAEAWDIPQDFFLSILIGTSITLFLFDRDRAVKSMSELPCVEGRSLVSDELCDAFVEQYEHIPKDVWTATPLESRRAEPYIPGIQAFCQNCIARKEVERMKKGSYGDDDKAHFSSLDALRVKHKAKLLREREQQYDQQSEPQ